jgi:hypothetical protein
MDKNKIVLGKRTNEPVELTGTEVVSDIGASSLITAPCGVKFKNGKVIEKWMQY